MNNSDLNDVIRHCTADRLGKRATLVMSEADNELFSAVESVRDEQTFLEFLITLREHREASVLQEKESPSSPYCAEAGGWENTTIERFLDAAVAWARASSKGLPLAGYEPPSNP